MFPADEGVERICRDIAKTILTDTGETDVTILHSSCLSLCFALSCVSVPCVCFLGWPCASLFTSCVACVFIVPCAPFITAVCICCSLPTCVLFFYLVLCVFKPL